MSVRRKTHGSGESSSSSVMGYTTETESSDSYKHDKKYPTKASEWKLGHLKELGIHYDETPIGLDIFVSNLKEGLPKAKPKAIDRDTEIPEINRSLLQLTKDWWKFSFDFECAEKSLTGTGVMESLEQAEEAIEIFEQENYNIVEGLEKAGQGGLKSLQTYSVWRMNLLDFWKYFSMLLTRWGKPYQREGRFTCLFMAFSKICFLYPEPGETYCEILQIKDVTVHGIPDVRFMTFPASSSAKKDLQLIVVTEVKQYDAFRGDYVKAEIFTYENMSKKVLGQHGIELLMERECSFFFPTGVVGVLCIGTKVIFTFLQISQAHYQQIRDKGKVDKSSKATISYTRPYNYMDASDRAEILETLFWFGHVQSNPKQFSIK